MKGFHNNLQIRIRCILFLRLRGFQYWPSRVHIEAQPILSTAKLARDINNSVDFICVGLRLAKHYAPSQHDTNCRLTCSDAFTHTATE